MNMIIPGYISVILERLRQCGFECYLVGGCVRDAMMGIAPHDFDLTTDATPDEMLDVFADYRIIETGLKHGTVTVVSDGENVEITTYRIDGEYIDNRRPEDVTFTRSLNEDLSRRDFTVNAFAYSPYSGLVDIFGGRDDLKNRLIRCVGEADKRFGEDGLRILRALRFSSCLNFGIHRDTALSIHRNKHLLQNISAERIYTELRKLVCGEGASSVIREYMDVFETVFPMVSECKDVIYYNACRLGDLPFDYITRFAALLYGVDTGIVREFMNSLKPDNYSRDSVVTICMLALDELPAQKVYIRKLMNKYDNELIYAAARIKNVFSKEFDFDAFISMLDNQIAHNPCVRIKQLAVDGSALMAKGFPKGPVIGKMLSAILDAVIEDKCENNVDSIMKYVDDIKEDINL